MANPDSSLRRVSPAKVLCEIADAVPADCRRNMIIIGSLAGRLDIKRSNKDIGRVLAIARLAVERNEDALLDWPETWKAALRDRFPDDWAQLARRAGQGLKKLMASEADLEQAWHTCSYGLLASDPPTLTALRIAGERLLRDAVEPMETETS